MAAVLADPHTRCAICGIPGRMLKAYARRGLPLSRDAYGNQVSVLTVDHNEPGGPSILGNVRVLCSPCNTMRGPALLEDTEVLRRARKLWIILLGRARTWWLNTEPGKGGRESRRISRSNVGTQYPHDEVPAGVPGAGHRN